MNKKELELMEKIEDVRHKNKMIELKEEMRIEDFGSRLMSLFSKKYYLNRLFEFC